MRTDPKLTLLCGAAWALGAFSLLANPPPAEVEEAMQQGFESTDPAVLAAAAQTLERQLAAVPGQTELRRALAILYLDRLNSPAKALPHLEKAVAETPEEGDWQLALGRGLRAVGRTSEAAVHYQRAAELKPGEAWPRYELANTLAAASQYAEAATAYAATVQLEPKNLEARVALAKTLWASGDQPGARHAAHEVLELDATNQTARALLAASPPAPRAGTPAGSATDAAVAAAYRSGRDEDFARAAAALEASLRRDPHQLAYRKSLAYLYLEKLHDLPRATVQIEKLAAALPHDSAWLEMLAKAQAAAGDRAGAAPTYREAAARAPRDLWARYHLGAVLRELGRPAEAEAAFREAYAVDRANPYVRRELARIARVNGRKAEAALLARGLLRENERDAEAHVVLGDLERAERDFSRARADYQVALATEPANSEAEAGLREMRRQQDPQAKVVYYSFDDTDHFRQSGVFSNLSALVTGKLSLILTTNERWFRRPPGERVRRFEAGVAAAYRLSDGLLLTGGGGEFATQHHGAVAGANAALYLMPATAVDLWASWRYSDPVNDSYLTARDALTQNILAAGFTLRPLPQVEARVAASTADYADGNTRRSALASLGWSIPLPASPVLRLEYEWLDYRRLTSEYSSPKDYARLRPVLELSPRLTSWLKLEAHAELSYVVDEHQWGYGLTIGPRINVGDRIELGFAYMKYEIPGGESTWSGDGFKADFECRF